MSKARHGKHHRKDGGETPMLVSGNPDVIKEAERDEEGGSRKRGGKVKKHRADGGKVARMHGGGVGLRLDRPGRKRGGGVGADKSPLSSAHDGSAGGGGERPSSKDTYGGTPED